MLKMIRVLFWFTVKILLGVLFYATPVIGFWLVSSLAAYLGGPTWMAWTAGAFLFPVIPGLWELHYSTHRSSKGKPILTLLDRISLRTFATGLVFIAGLLYLYPQASFVALSTRGDWMLDGVKDVRADRVRQVLFTSATGLEWLYDATKNNPYKSLIDPKARQLAEEATKQRENETLEKNGNSEADRLDSLLFRPVPIAKNDSTNGEASTKSDQKQTKSKGEETKTESRDEKNKIWPWKQSTLHPAVASMPASVETSIESVARYIAEKESDPFLRIKALHDYVADRVAYDSDSYYAGVYPPQDAETTFRTRKSVCAGYANLLSALAQAIDEKIVVVVGNARDQQAGDRLSGLGHAWNAALINDHWYLIDVTWDSGYVSREKGFTKEYKTNYLLIPPDVMIEDHFPEEATWQLLAQPLSQGEFLRQPMLRPSFQVAGLELLNPTRAQNDAESNAVAIIKNPRRRWIMASMESGGRETGTTDSTNAETTRVEFQLPDKGTYRLKMFVNSKSKYDGAYEYVGSVDYVKR